MNICQVSLAGNIEIIKENLKKLNYQTFMFNQPILEGHGWGKVITSIAINLKKRSLGYLVKNDHAHHP